MQKERRFPKKCVIFLTIVLVLLLVSCWNHTFTVQKWRDRPDARRNIVDNMLSRYDLIGMTEGELFKLLGEEEPLTEDGYALYVYGIGMERGWISVDNEFLFVRVEDGMVTDHYFMK